MRSKTLVLVIHNLKWAFSIFGYFCIKLFKSSKPYISPGDEMYGAQTCNIFVLFLGVNGNEVAIIYLLGNSF